MPDSLLFIADVMLGSLAKWLRILGFDTLYFNRIDDNELVRIAGRQQRVLLTRDTGIAKRKRTADVVLITSDDVFEQLRETLAFIRDKGQETGSSPSSSHPLPLVLSRSRCPRCNGKLDPASREEVMDAVPAYVLLKSRSFFRCRECGKVYWAGSHMTLIYEKLGKIMKGMNIQWEISDGE